MMLIALLLAAAPLDRQGAPLKFYLTLDDVKAHLNTLELELSECQATKDVSQAVEVIISSDGGVTLDWGKAERDGFLDCITNHVEAKNGPQHYGSPTRVSTTLYVRDGRIMFSPSPTMVARYVGPLMVYVSGGRQEREAVVRHLSRTSTEER